MLKERKSKQNIAQTRKIKKRKNQKKIRFFFFTLSCFFWNVLNCFSIFLFLWCFGILVNRSFLYPEKKTCIPKEAFCIPKKVCASPKKFLYHQKNSCNSKKSFLYPKNLIQESNLNHHGFLHGHDHGHLLLNNNGHVDELQLRNLNGFLRSQDRTTGGPPRRVLWRTWVVRIQQEEAIRSLSTPQFPFMAPGGQLQWPKSRRSGKTGVVTNLLPRILRTETLRSRSLRQFRLDGQVQCPNTQRSELDSSNLDDFSLRSAIRGISIVSITCPCGISTMWTTRTSTTLPMCGKNGISVVFWNVWTIQHHAQYLCPRPPAKSRASARRSWWAPEDS